MAIGVIGTDAPQLRVGLQFGLRQNGLGFFLSLFDQLVAFHFRRVVLLFELLAVALIGFISFFVKGLALGQWAVEHRADHIHAYWMSTPSTASAGPLLSDMRSPSMVCTRPCRAVAPFIAQPADSRNLAAGGLRHSR